MKTPLLNVTHNPQLNLLDLRKTSNHQFIHKNLHIIIYQNNGMSTYCFSTFAHTLLTKKTKVLTLLNHGVHQSVMIHMNYIWIVSQLLT